MRLDRLTVVERRGGSGNNKCAENKAEHADAQSSHQSTQDSRASLTTDCSKDPRLVSGSSTATAAAWRRREQHHITSYSTTL